jgi:hypothetical protein
MIEKHYKSEYSMPQDFALMLLDVPHPGKI